MRTERDLQRALAAEIASGSGGIPVLGLLSASTATAAMDPELSCEAPCGRARPVRGHAKIRAPGISAWGFLQCGFPSIRLRRGDLPRYSEEDPARRASAAA